MSARAAAFRVVGVVLLIAAITKSISPYGLAAFLEFVGFPAGASHLFVLTIIVVEAAIGGALLFDPHWRTLRVITALLVTSFLFAPVVRWMYPEAPGCGCFGAWLTHPALHSPMFEFGRGLLLLGLVVLGSVVPRSSPNVESARPE